MEKNDLIFRGVVGYVSQQEHGISKTGEPTKKGYFIVGEPYGTVPNEIRIDWFNRKTSVDNLQVGDEVEVYFNLKCTEWNGKHLFSANLWKMNNISNPKNNENVSSAGVNKYSLMSKQNSQTEHVSDTENEKDLPF